MGKKIHKHIDLFLFLLISIGVFFVDILLTGSHHFLLYIPLVAVPVYFLIRKSDLFGPSLFFLLLYLTYLIPGLPKLWMINLGIALAIYITVCFAVKPMKKNIDWLKVGKIDKWTILLILLTIIVSSTALIIWTKIFQPDINAYLGMLPKNIALSLLLIVGFSIANAIAEEFVFRGLFWNGLKESIKNIVVIIIIQAFFFGLVHYSAGFPNGIVGVILVFIYGVFLGIIRHRSKGMLAPILTHIFADITITLIMLKIGGVI